MADHPLLPRLACALLIVIFGVNACSVQTSTATTSPAATGTPSPSPSATPSLPRAEITFEVDLPQQTPAGQKIYLNILDEVTGLAYNQSQYVMESKSQTHYSVRVPLPVGSAVKYRFSRDGKPALVETTCGGKLVRYRLFLVNGQDSVNDIVCGWSDLHPEGARGRITGKILAAGSGEPLVDILVSAGGVSTLTSSDGSYLLEGLSPGVHNLTAYSLDGAYSPFQQGASVAADATTPASIELNLAKMVDITFRVAPPKDMQQGLPLRFIGNLSTLGNTFSDLRGGISTVAYRAPLMRQEADGHYSLTLSLPSGLDLRYKYTLGDGYWNGELDADGKANLRQVIVPTKGKTIEDRIATFQADDGAPVTFQVRVPKDTPASDSISIQLNETGWGEPLPMWPLGDNVWTYNIYNPLTPKQQIRYRYCRNEQCGSADDTKTAGQNAAGRTINPNGKADPIQDVVASWTGWQTVQTPASGPIKGDVRKAPFLAGVEFQTNFNPSWQPHLNSAYHDIGQLGARWVVLTPSWQYTSTNPPVLEPLAGKTPLWNDLLETAGRAKKNGLQLALYPAMDYGMDSAGWWQAAKRDSDWWQRWFERYSNFARYHADLATASGAGLLILGEPGLIPALPNGKLSDGSASGVPGDAPARWKELIADVRSRFKGQIAWAISYPDGMKPLPGFISDIDQVYILWSAPFSEKQDPSLKDLSTYFENRLKKDIQPLQTRLKKPVLLGLAYPSVKGAEGGCLVGKEICLPFSTLNQPVDENSVYGIDMQQQALVYQAVLDVIRQPKYSWLSGLVSRGYYPPARLQDQSTSVHGKPAEEVLKVWFTRLQAK